MHTKKSILKTLIVVSILFLLVANSKTITNSFRARFTDLSVQSLKSVPALLSLVKRFLPFASLREENRRLKERVDLLERNLEEMRSLRDENSRLKTLLGFRKTVGYETIPAQVIGRDPTNWSNTLIIDKGLSHGIRRNKAVVSVRGLVGRLVEIGRYSSKILLITDPNSKVGVVVQRNRQGGILVGRPDGRCKMIYISLDADVAPGDKVVTAGVSSIFPKDVLTGEVIKVGKEPGRLYKYAIVRTSEDLSKLEEVLCIK